MSVTTSFQIASVTVAANNLEFSYQAVATLTTPAGFSLDHIGPIARSAADCALILSIISGSDAADPTAASVPYRITDRR